MPLIRGNWDLNANGRTGVLEIESVDVGGQVVGTIGIRGVVLEFDGIWDETARRILIAPKSLMPVPTVFEFLTGYLISTPAEPEPGQDVLWTLVGFIEVNNLLAIREYGGNARRHTFGWFAQTTEVA